MTTNPTSDDQKSGKTEEPDSTNGTGAESDQEHKDDPVTGIGSEDPS